MIDWDKWLAEKENSLENRGYRKYNQKFKGEDFTYWKSFEGYQVGILFYDFRKYIDIDHSANKISLLNVITSLDGTRTELIISKEIGPSELEDIAIQFYKFYKKNRLGEGNET